MFHADIVTIPRPLRDGSRPTGIDTCVTRQKHICTKIPNLNKLDLVAFI